MCDSDKKNFLPIIVKYNQGENNYNHMYVSERFKGDDFVFHCTIKIYSFNLFSSESSRTRSRKLYKIS